jgi:hypothetical protein
MFRKTKLSGILIILSSILITTGIVYFLVQAGTLNNALSPAPTFYTLTDIYTRLTTNVTATEADHNLGPSASPDSTGYTLTQIYEAIPTIDASKVLSGTTYLGITGTIADREGDNVSTAQTAGTAVSYFTAPTGFYDGDDRVSATDAEIVALDDNLVADNIKDTVEIFGVTGTYAGSGGSYSFPATGQTISYRANDDGDLEAGAVLSYTDNGDGTTTDNNTSLMWAQDGNGTGCNNGVAVTWENAIDYCANLTFAGYSDWYLPNIKELISLVKYDASISAPYIDHTYFPNTQSNLYWSSTTHPFNTTYALNVYFSNGDVDFYNKTGSKYVRCVRGQ